MLSIDEIDSNIQNLLGQANYSGAQTTLNEVNSLFNICLKVSNNRFADASVDSKELLETNNLILKTLSNGFENRVHYTQRETAKKILSRYYINKSYSD